MRATNVRAPHSTNAGRTVTARTLMPGDRVRHTDARVHQRHYLRPATPGACADAVAAGGGAHLYVRRPDTGNRRTDGWAPTGRVVSTLPVAERVITRRPHADMSDRGRDARGPLRGGVCPGCGIERPTGRNCVQCWD